MTKYVPKKLTQLSANESAAVDIINQNFDSIKEHIDDALSRTAKAPSQMQATLDMNGQKIINIGVPTQDTDLVRQKDVVADKEEIKQLVNTASIAVEKAMEAAETAEEAAEDMADQIQLAKDWATKTDGPVADGEYSSKYYAEQIGADVHTVADIATDVTAVAGNATNINTVASDATNINAVAEDLTNIDAVAANATNINAVNSNKTNIDAVAGNKTNIDTVAGISSNVTTVAGMSSNISSVVSDSTNINSVASDLINIDAVASELPSIITKANTNASNFTATGESYLSGLGMPSGSFEDQANTTYTAPANGYAFVQAASGTTNGYVSIICNDGTDNYRQIATRNANGSQYAMLLMPCKKGDEVKVGRENNGTLSYNRFIYAEGEV